MKKIILSSTIACALLLACKPSNTQTNSVSMQLEAKSNSNVKGTATFTEKNGVVSMTARVSGLKPGVHAIHIHEKADCSAGDATSAGGHWNPTHVQHGKWGDNVHHKGDIGNFTADDQGEATVTFATDQWCIGCGDITKDILNKGLIVHDKADDYVTQPTGNAGGRVACAGIIK